MKSALHTFTLLTLFTFSGLTACGTQEPNTASQSENSVEAADLVTDEGNEETHDEVADEEETYDPEDHDSETQEPENSLELSDKLDVGEQYSGINERSQQGTDGLDRADSLDQRATFGN